MIQPGLCSVTFRPLTAEEIIALVSKTDLAAIEWGGDIHVPHGDVARAKEVAKLCADAGLATPSYGSYFRTDPSADEPEFSAVLDSAVALGAKTIRIWAGQKESAQMTGDDWKRLTDESLRVASLAGDAGCEVAFEYHLYSATDDNAAVERLLRESDHPAVSTYWQPRQKLTTDERLESLRAVLPKLAHLHVFQWAGDPIERRPLAEGVEAWNQYFQLADTAEGERFAFLEFVKDDSAEAFIADAAVLSAMLRSK